MPEIYLSRQEIIDRLGVGLPLFRLLRRQGGPAPHGAGKKSTWPLYAWCEWLVQRRANGAHAQEVTLRAAQILRQRDGIPDPEPQPSAPPATIEPEVLEPELDPEGVGLDHALQRLRRAEADTGARWRAAWAAGAAEAPIFFKDWQQALDLLRKAEKNLSDHLQQQRELAPMAEFEAWMSRQISVAKTILLDLPAKVAPLTEGMAWPEVQKLLHKEIVHALGKLSGKME